VKVITFLCYRFGLVHTLVGSRVLKTARIGVCNFFFERMYHSKKVLEFTVPRLAGHYSLEFIW
jgi:hypothetical protein